MKKRCEILERYNLNVEKELVELQENVDVISFL